MRSLCLEHLLAVAENRERTQKEDPGQRFPVILPGFLLNFCTDKPEAVEAAGIPMTLLQYLKTEQVKFSSVHL